MSASKLIRTRKTIMCPVFGAPCDFNCSVLPSFEDVIKCFLHVRYDLKCPGSGKEPTVSEICEIVSDKMCKIWKKATIPIVSRTRVIQCIQAYHDKYLKLIRHPKSKQNNSYLLKKKEFQVNAQKLFDISCCKCKYFENCVCEMKNKVPVKERPFLTDQRTERKMYIGNVDIVETTKMEKRAERKRKASKFEEIQQLRVKPGVDFTALKSDTVRTRTTEELNNHPSTSKQETKKIKSKEQNRIQLNSFPQICDRYGLSDRSAAAIASAVLHDVGIISEDNTTNVIDRSKVRRARTKKRESLQNKSIEKSVNAIYFDGKKDKTLIVEKRGNKQHRRTIVEEHITLIQEPGSVYIGHTTPCSSSAKSITNSMFNFLAENNYDLDQLLALGCDGTVVNTGSKNGVISQIELRLNRPIQWLICQLHSNELPLRHLFNFLDGGTSGPRGYVGPIGKLLETCHNLPVIRFEPIACDLPEVVTAELSTDQNYLYQICTAISKGECSLDLSNLSPGKLAHSRWLTTANRILRLYVASENPSSNLQELTKFIQNVYAPTWFDIKFNPSCKHGAKNVWKTIKRSRYLKAELKNIIDPVIQRNAYFLHPENILISMLADDRIHVRELALRRILKARTAGHQTLRSFVIPKINFDASDYIDLIDWHATVITLPPILANLTTKEIEDLIIKDSNKMVELIALPTHTQAVERCVKLVSESCLSVVGAMARDDFIKVTLKSRKEMPSFNTKKDFNQ